ncbi:MAG: signal peptidase II [Clostridia bacterium]|nr:signal peptidase II [Clostridia bacterium]
MNKNRILVPVVQLCAIALLVFIDYELKELAVRRLTLGETVTLIPNVLGLQLAHNTGAAFSLFSSATTALSVVTGAVLLAVFIAQALIKKKPKIFTVLVPLIIAGGTGNLVDRIRQGYVIDYIRTLFIDFPIFNFADIMITCSCVILIVYLIVGIVRDGRKKEADGPEKDVEAV